jgi:hypothetical protein
MSFFLGAAPAGTLSPRQDMVNRGMPQLQTLRIYYRISSGGYNKPKPAFVTKETCLANFLREVSVFCVNFPSVRVELVILCDSCKPSLREFVSQCTRQAFLDHKNLHVQILDSSHGNGAGSFRQVMNMALDAPSSVQDVHTGLYFVEDDYLHVPNGIAVVILGLELAHYATGYDHPDKYSNSCVGGLRVHTNQEGLGSSGEACVVLRGADRHYKTTHSTTMTFATTLSTFRADATLISMHVEGDHPNDLAMFLALLTCSSRVLVSPLPAACTHGETAHLSPYIPWHALVPADPVVPVVPAVPAITATTEKPAVHPQKPSA